mgnify:FL=1
MNKLNLLESVFKELINKNIIILEGDQEEGKEEIKSSGGRTSLKLPRFKINEKAWGTDVNTEDRSTIEMIGAQLKGDMPLDRINYVQKFLTETETVKEDITVGEVMAALMFLDIFASIVMDFNAAVAGFLFEALFAGIFEGYQIPATTAETPADVSLTIRKMRGVKTDKFYSFKLLTKRGKVSEKTGKAGAGSTIEGSATDLLRGFLQGEKELTYLVGLKTGGGKGAAMTIDFYEFDINQETWFDWVGPPNFTAEEVLEKVEFVYGVDEPEIVRNKISSRGRREGKIAGDEFIPRPRTKVKGHAEYEELEGPEVTRDIPIGTLITRYGLADESGQPVSYLQTGQKYSVNIITGSKQVLSSLKNANFMELYGPYVTNKIKFEHPQNKSFIEYVMSGEYKTDTRFFEHLKKLPKFAKGGQFLLYQTKLLAGGAGMRGPATVTLDRQKFLKAADDYTEKVGQQIYDLFTNLANLVDHVSGYYLGASAAERNNFANDAKKESKAVADSAQKHLVKVESDVMKGVVLDPAPASPRMPAKKAPSAQQLGESEELDLKGLSKEILENIKKPS